MDKKLLIKLARAVMKLSEIKIGDKVYYSNGDIAIGVEVMDENGEYLADGEYVVDNQKLVIKDGKIEVIETIEPEVVEMEEVIEEILPEPVEQPAVKDEKDLRIEELEKLLRDKDVIIDELNAKIKELEDKSEAPTEASVAMNKVNASNDCVTGALRYFQK